MNPQFDISKLDDLKGISKVPFKCELCEKIFFAEVKYVRYTLKKRENQLRYCGMECSHIVLHKQFAEKCKHCDKDIIVLNNVKQSSKTGNFFCSQSCAAKYNNAHKKTGTRRSKLEVYIQSKLEENFPGLEIICNGKETINSELDFYFPSLKLAIELNGIFHYEPIYGAEKFASIQNNDDRKFQACLERGIELLIIDSSKLSYFKPANADKYWEIVRTIISDKLSRA